MQRDAWGLHPCCPWGGKPFLHSPQFLTKGVFPVFCLFCSFQFSFHILLAWRVRIRGRYGRFGRHSRYGHHDYHNLTWMYACPRSDALSWTIVPSVHVPDRRPTYLSAPLALSKVPKTSKAAHLLACCVLTTVDTLVGLDSPVLQIRLEPSVRIWSIVAIVRVSASMWRVDYCRRLGRSCLWRNLFQ